MLQAMLDIRDEIGPQASFAGLADHLREADANFEPIIAEVAGETEQDLEVVRLELVGALRQTKMKWLKGALADLISRGIQSDEDRQQYRELTARQDQLRREAEAETSRR